MYVAKRNGRGTVAVYTPNSPSMPESIDLVDDLEVGIPRGELVVLYQPKVDLEPGRIVGAEALVRWQHPDRGLLMPAVFLPAVERSALIIDLTLEVLRSSILEAHHWGTHLLPRDISPSVAVNISRRCLVHRDFPSRVALMLATTGVRSDSLILEITEAADWGAHTVLRVVGRRGVGDSVGGSSTNVVNVIGADHLCPASTPTFIIKWQFGCQLDARERS